VPDLPVSAAANRRFLRRAVTYLANNGVRQFVDIGAGIPTVGNTARDRAGDRPRGPRRVRRHRRRRGRPRDGDPRGNPNAVVVQGDFRAPEALLGDIKATGLVDPTSRSGCSWSRCCT
jgi:hypothetical protein